MTPRSVTHATFVIERVYPASPARVFAAFSQPALKARWFVGPDDWQAQEHRLDFRVGGREINRGGPPGGPVHAFDAVYQDIVQDRRIVFTYDMHVGDARLSVSLTTVELVPEGKGTRLIFTEQGAFLDGHEAPAQRELGTRELLESLARALETTAVTA